MRAKTGLSDWQEKYKMSGYKGITVFAEPDRTFLDTASTCVDVSTSCIAPIGGNHYISPLRYGATSKTVMFCPACHSTMKPEHVGNCDHCGAPGGDMKLKRIRFTDE